MRRYVQYQLVADDGQVNEFYENYKSAYSDFYKEVRNGNSATLYGVTSEGSISVIVSK